MTLLPQPQETVALQHQAQCLAPEKRLVSAQSLPLNFGVLTPHASPHFQIICTSAFPVFGVTAMERVLEAGVLFFLIYFLFFVFLSFRAAPMACGGSQARGLIGAVATGLHHSHSNARSELHLQPTPQLTAMPIFNPLSEARDRTCNPMVLRQTRFCCVMTGSLGGWGFRDSPYCPLASEMSLEGPGFKGLGWFLSQLRCHH